MAAITLDQLSAEDRNRLMSEVLELEADKQKRIKEDRQAYKRIVNETIPELFTHLLKVSAVLSAAKAYVFDELQALIEMKSDIYGKEKDQYSHSFTTDDGITLIIGNRILDGWDDTVTAGINKVNEYLESLGDGAKGKTLLKTVRLLLSNNNKERLKASRVLQLKKIADETGDKEFKDAIAIIQDAYRPTKSKEFVTVLFKDNKGNKADLALDMSSAEFEFKYPSAYAKYYTEKSTTTTDVAA